MRSTLKTVAMLAFAGLLLGSCASIERRDHPALWRVEATNGNQLWLLGSIHRLPPEMQPRSVSADTRSPLASNRVPASANNVIFKRPVSSRLRESMPPAPWFNGPLQRAFRSSRVVMLEVDRDHTRDELLSMLARNEQPIGCRNPVASLSPQEFERYRKIIGRPEPESMPESGPGALFALAELRTPRTQLDVAVGVDYWIARQARRSGKSVLALESVEDRLAAMRDAMDTADCDTQRDMLRAMMHVGGSGESFEDPWFLAAVGRWRDGDMKSMARQMRRFKRESPRLYYALIQRRNQRWLPRVLDQLRSTGSTLVVAGAAHMAGPGSLIELLSERGLSVERIQ